MAKVTGSFITRLKGSIGNTTFRQNGSTNVASQKVKNPKNPCTPAQIEQRMYAKVVNAGYSVLKRLCDHSFEGYKIGASSMSRFLSLNQQEVKNQTKLTTFFLPKESTRMYAPNEFQISDGSLYSLPTYGSNSDGAAVIGQPLGDFTSIKKVTVEMVHKFLHAEIGDQITIVGVAPYGNYSESDLSQCRLLLSRYVFKQGTEKEEAFDTTTQMVRTENLDMDKSSIGDVLLYGGKRKSSSTDFCLVIAGNYTEEGNYDLTNTSNLWSVGYILSRKNSDGTWLRSPSFLANNDTISVNLEDNKSDYSYAKAFDSYKSSNLTDNWVTSE